MKHEIIDTVLNVSDTDITFDGIYEKAKQSDYHIKFSMQF